MSPQPERTVLVADADEEHAAALTEALEAAGYHVERAVDVDACVQALRHARPVVVVLDAGLAARPAELCRRLREMHEGREVGLLVVLRGGEDLPELVARGADDFLVRPVEPSLLLHRVRTAAGGGRRRPAAAPGGGDLNREAFLAHVGERVLEARAEGRHLALFRVDLVPSGGSLDTSDPTLGEVLRARLRTAFEGEGAEGLDAYLSAMRITRCAPLSFCVCVPSLPSVQEAARIGSRLRDAFAVPVEWPERPLAFSPTVGVAVGPSDGTEATELLERAREATERSRQEGGDTLQFFTESMGRWAFERLTLAKSLRDAIANEELRVFYQPRIDAQTRQIRGMEALVRWQHPQLGLVAPAQFIPLAEETGLIVPIGEWVLRQACAQNKAWRKRGLPPVRVSVNLSPVQFGRPDLFERVMATLQETGLSADGLELEVTESMLMNDPKETIATLQRFRRAGIHLSIDDFGTGYSSLNYLKRFPIDALKIDKSFITEVTTNPEDAAITTAIILMGHSLKLTVVAEGVETESQMEFLQVLRCNEIQGYLFSPPVPPDQAQALLERELRSAA